MFSILGERLAGARTLDLFAGSGALGIEALSRGAAGAVFVEENGGACGIITANLEAAGVQGTVVRGDVFRFLERATDSFDLVFADPPYAVAGRDDLAGRLLESSGLARVLAAGGMVAVEVESDREPPESECWRLAAHRIYGGSAILFYEAAGNS
jgi:16S rRNA (guanine966-N2)-methyltransferase